MEERIKVAPVCTSGSDETFPESLLVTLRIYCRVYGVRVAAAACEQRGCYTVYICFLYGFKSFLLRPSESSHILWLPCVYSYICQYRTSPGSSPVHTLLIFTFSEA